MKVELNATAVLAVVGLAVGGFVVYKLATGATAVGAAVADAANAVNPLNHDNVFAGAVNDLGGAVVTDPAGPGKNADGSWSLGGWVYDITHPGTVEELRKMGGATGSW